MYMVKECLYVHFLKAKAKETNKHLTTIFEFICLEKKGKRQLSLSFVNLEHGRQY